jgi:hypothetical protein
MPAHDVELAAIDTIPAKGFASVSSKIASDPDKSTTIYRHFDELSARNLLFYQAELAELEEEQRQCDVEDKTARDQPSVECQRDWREFVSCAENGGREKRKMELAMRIRAVLMKYRTFSDKCVNTERDEEADFGDR